MPHEPKPRALVLPQEHLAIETHDAVRFVFNDTVDVSTFHSAGRLPRERSLSIRYMDNIYGAALSDEVSADGSGAEWLEARVLKEPGHFVWESERTLVFGPPVGGWQPSKFVRFEFADSVADVHGNPIRPHRGPIIARVHAKPNDPAPSFKMRFIPNKAFVAIDQRSSQLKMVLTASGIDPETHIVDDVLVLINAHDIPIGVSLCGISKTNQESWQVIGRTAQMRGDGDTQEFNIAVKTGFFSFLDRNSARGSIQVTTHLLQSWHSAKSGHVRIGAKVCCIVRRISDPTHADYPTTPIEFTIQRD